KKRNKEGKLWAAMQLEDLVGSMEAMVFASSFEQIGANLVEDKPMLIRGMVLPEENAPPKLSIKDVTLLENARVYYPTLIGIKIWLDRNGVDDKASALSDLFRKKPGQTEVRLRLERSRDFSLLLDVDTKVRPDKEFKAELQRICGPESLEIISG
ncbi:MAG: DNA polymerase III subunit alpha, partial [Bryobacteraceae bacterium]